LFQGERSPVVDKAREAALSKANETASRMATSILATELAVRDKEKLVEEQMKKLFPKERMTPIK
jgi:hypothetical protein